MAALCSPEETARGDDRVPASLTRRLQPQRGRPAGEGARRAACRAADAADVTVVERDGEPAALRSEAGERRAAEVGAWVAVLQGRNGSHRRQLLELIVATAPAGCEDMVRELAVSNPDALIARFTEYVMDMGLLDEFTSASDEASPANEAVAQSSIRNPESEIQNREGIASGVLGAEQPAVVGPAETPECPSKSETYLIVDECNAAASEVCGQAPQAPATTAVTGALEPVSSPAPGKAGDPASPSAMEPNAKPYGPEASTRVNRQSEIGNRQSPKPRKTLHRQECMILEMSMLRERTVYKSVCDGGRTA